VPTNPPTLVKVIGDIKMLGDIVHKMVMMLTPDDVRGILIDYERLVGLWESGAYGEIDGKTLADVRGRLDELQAALRGG